MHGVLIVDKGRGQTSHDVVDAIRRILRTRQVGHAGTLDPLATGVLVVCVGRATKIASFLMEDEKEYLAEVRLGVSTDTFDSEGRVTGRVEGVEVAEEVIQAVCRRFIGEMEQRPPMFSAVKVGGRRLYELARAGEEVEVPPRRVTVREIEVMGYCAPMLSLRVVCSKGTYIRALADDLGRALDVGGHVAALRRIRSGPFTIDEARTVEEVAEWIRGGGSGEGMLSIREALRQFPAVRLDGERVGRFCNGNVVRVEGLTPGISATVRVEDEGGRFYGVGMVEGSSGLLRPLRVLFPPERHSAVSGQQSA